MEDSEDDAAVAASSSPVADSVAAFEATDDGSLKQPAPITAGHRNAKIWRADPRSRSDGDGATARRPRNRDHSASLSRSAPGVRAPGSRPRRRVYRSSAEPLFPLADRSWPRTPARLVERPPAAQAVPGRRVPGEASQPSKWAVLAIIGVGVFMATLDSSIVNVSLPTIAAFFGVPLGPEVEWIVIAYLVVIGAVLLTVGRLADLYGRRRIWALGLVVFSLSSALCGLAPSIGALIAARAVQGIGGAMLMGVSPAMLVEAFPAHERGRAIGLNAVVVGLGVSAGPSLGGILTEHASWRWIFFINVPIGAIGLVASLRVLSASATDARGRFDPIGAILLALALAGLTGGLSLGHEIGWADPIAIAIDVVAVGSTIAFVLWERRHPHPVVDPSLFADRRFTSATVSLVLSFLAGFAVPFLMPFYFEQLRHLDTAHTGLLLTPLPLTLAIVAPVSGALADRIGTRGLAMLGMGTLCLGLFALASLDADSTDTDAIWRLVLVGLGQGLFQSPNNSELMGAAPEDRRGVASGMLATGRVVGQSLSVAIAGALFAGLGGAAAGMALHDAAAADASALNDTFTAAYRTTLHVAAAIAALGVVTSATRGRSRRDDRA
jgi:EmrB/QacA subfamily drug resistance transporter